MLHAQANRLAIVIPAYRPPDRLLDLARQLSQSFGQVVIVDDGSGADFRELFARASELPGVEILRHATNLGRGAATKTGINYALCSFPDFIGLITAEPGAEPADIERVAQNLLAHPESIVQPAADSVLHALTGRDSQTGLRGIPEGFAPRVLQIEANGLEFDLELLLAARRSGVPVVEESIRTAPSQFNPLLESTKLYFLLPRFAAVALATALLDNLIFIQALHHGWPLLWSLALGRIFGVAFNYPLVRGAVFRSRERHGSVLPKYLLLALADTAVAYAGIRLLGIPAKLLIELLLFLVNFAIQRLYIFTGLPSSGRKRAFPFTPVVAAVFLCSLAIEAHGFLTANLFSQDIWEPIGVKRFLKYIGMFVGIAFPLLTMVPWTFAAAVTALTAAGTAFAIGPLALLAVAFYLISSCAVGSRLLGRKHSDSPESQVFSTLLGAAVWICAMNLVARIPVNYPAVWAALLAIPVLLDGRGAWRRIERWWQLLRGAELRRYPERIAFAAVVFVLLAHWFVALMPETSADGLAMHLAIPMNIAANHAMTYQPSRLVWAVMPMGADFSYAIVYLLGGEYAAHLLDYVVLLLLEAVLYFAIRRWLCRAASFWLLALFASTPLVQLVTGSLFVENILAAMVAGMAAALWRFADSGEKRFFYLAAALGGTATAVKFGALAFVVLAVPFLAVEAVRHWKSLGPRPAAACLLAGVLLVGMAAPPYAIAYLKTGNPLFPFLYDKIPTPLIPRDAGIVDERFKRPLTWNTPYDLTFRTNLTYEGQNGSFGFQYLVFAPLGLAALLVAPRRRDVLSAVAVALGAAAIIMRTQPNARYLYSALPLLSVPFAALLAWSASTRWLYRGLLAFVVACVAMNMRFMPSASYYHRDFCLRLPFSRAERDRFRAGAAPVRDVIDYYNREYPHSVAMMTAESAIAGLRGEFYENHWHQIRTLLRLREIKTVDDMVKLMQSWKVDYFISPKPEIADAVKPVVLKEMLERCTQPVYEQGDEYLARLQPDCRPAKERTGVLVHPGSYDDFDPALLYRGDWTHDNHTFAEADRRTVSFTDLADAEVEIDFEGKALTYVYTKAVNRGIASVTIDGADLGTVDLYSARTEWQSRTRFCCFAPGRHVAIVRATGTATPQSKGKFIDLDSFTVE
jgi:glycosyltransferase involved in cell wall biosynthesis